MDDQTPRFGLPMLFAGQAQKEVLHNEALATIDRLIGAVAETIGDNAPPAAPAIGASWIVGDAPGGDWSGQPGALASWTDGGWRFTPPVEGLRVWVRAIGGAARRTPSTRTHGELDGTALRVGGVQVVGPRQPAIAPPSGGATIDAQARATLAIVLSALQFHGLIAG